MPKKNVVAIDDSYSTGNVKTYWVPVSRYLETQDEDTQFIFWNHKGNTEEQNKKQALATAKRMSGRGLTEPAAFAKLLLPDEEGINLTIFTDGQVQQNHVNDCDNVLQDKDIKIKQLKVFFIGPKEEMNLSVSAPFMRSERELNAGMDCELYLNGDRINDDFKLTFFKIDEYLGKPGRFLEILPSFTEALRLKNLARKNNDKNFRDQLIKLQKNLLATVAKNKQSDEVKTIQTEWMLSLQNKDEKSAISKLENFIGKLTNGTADEDEIEKKIEAGFQKILAILDGKSDYSLVDQLNASRITRAPEVKEEKIEETKDIPIESSVAFECPIMLDNALPVLPIKAYDKENVQGVMVEKYPPIFKGLDSKYQNFLINNPLAILDNPELRDKIQARLDKPVGHGAIKSISKNNNGQRFSSPFTRELISSFISTSSETSHKKMTHYALADLFFGKDKLCGVPELWLAVVYFVAKNTEQLRTENNFSDFTNSFKENLINQLKNNDSYMALSGLSADGPLIKVPVALAVWYCVVSPKLKGVPNRLRSIGRKHHLNLLDELAYPYDRAWTLHQLAIYRVFAEMSEQKKQDSKKLDKWVRSLYQNSITVDDTIIMLDGRSKHDPKLLRISLENVKSHTYCLNKNNTQDDENLVTLSIGEVLTLYQWVDPSKSLGAIPIPNDVPESIIPTAAINYNTQENEESGYTELCPYTLRPYSNDPVSKKPWNEAAEEKFGPLSGQISLYNYFVRYVTEQEKMPSQEQFIIWLEEKQSQREDQENKKNTLPKTIQADVDNAFRSFTTAATQLFSDACSEQASKLFKSFQIEKSNSMHKKNSFTLAEMSVALFKKITGLSRNKEKRLELELAYKQTLDTELNDGNIINVSRFFNNRRNSSSLEAENLRQEILTDPVQLGQYSK